ncbi:GerMN domain-containing protein [Streptomyces sp. JHA26]|uniref:GerMN domain-containing protein n=1 Tax=Streptomyces sp. JHA26 TaxID=1917143 RepID=UPI00098ADBEC|nr:GerMN domain-containing protein [Streptomyces sp. JHA26]
MNIRHALPALLATALALSACDIPATGVVEAGEPATGVLEPQGTTPAPEESRAVPVATVPLYFVSDGSLVAVPRELPGGAELGITVLMLFKGPNAGEREQGLTTELPRAGAAPTLRTDGATVTVGLPPAAAGLSDTAVDQLACTVAGARLRQDPELGSVQVTVEQPGGRLAGRSSDDCPGTAAAAPTVAPSG